jgi:hypothetical protein
MGLPVFVAILVVVLLAESLHFGFQFSDAAAALRHMVWPSWMTGRRCWWSSPSSPF